MKTDKHDVHDSELPTLTNTRKLKRYVIDNSSDEEEEQNNDNDLLLDNIILSKSSTPRSRTKTCLKPEFSDEIPRVENDKFDCGDPDLDEFKFEHIPYLSELSTDASFDGNERGNGSNKLDGEICDAIFGDKGAINADASIDFETKSRKVIEEAYVYPKFVNYFKNKLQPSIKNNAPTRKFSVATN